MIKQEPTTVIHSAGDLVKEAVLRREELGGIGRTTLWHLRRLPDFPSAFQITPKLKVYSRTATRNWIQSRKVQG